MKSFRIIISLLFALAMGQAFAQVGELHIAADKQFGHGFSAGGLIEYRTDNHMRNSKRLKYELTLGYRFTPWLKGDFYFIPMLYQIDGKRYADGTYFKKFYQFRPRYSVALTGSWSSGPLRISIRERYQLTCRPTKDLETFDPHGVSVGIKHLSSANAQVLRSRIRIACATGGIVTPFTTIETHNSLTRGFRLNETRYQWGFDIDITPRNSLNVNYMLISYGARQDNSHIFHIGYTYHF